MQLTIITDQTPPPTSDRTGPQVPQEQLEPVLRVASQLKIRGLDSDYSRESSLEPERYFFGEKSLGMTEWVFQARKPAVWQLKAEEFPKVPLSQEPKEEHGAGEEGKRREGGGQRVLKCECTHPLLSPIRKILSYIRTLSLMTTKIILEILRKQPQLRQK